VKVDTGLLVSAPVDTGRPDAAGAQGAGYAGLWRGPGDAAFQLVVSYLAGGRMGEAGPSGSLIRWLMTASA
jgi:hypothetical protein